MNQNRRSLQTGMTGHDRPEYPLFEWRVDPRGGRQPGRLWALAFEAAGVGGKGGVQGSLARFDELMSEAIVDVVGCHVGNAAMAVLIVVPSEEGLAVGACCAP
jgi:hypothetical protein